MEKQNEKSVKKSLQRDNDDPLPPENSLEPKNVARIVRRPSFHHVLGSLQSDSNRHMSLRKGGLYALMSIGTPVPPYPEGSAGNALDLASYTDYLQITQAGPAVQRRPYDPL